MGWNPAELTFFAEKNVRETSFFVTKNQGQNILDGQRETRCETVLGTSAVQVSVLESVKRQGPLE